jgi:trimeric autotransporter adhesin
LDGDGVFSDPAEVIETFAVDGSQFSVTVDSATSPTSATVVPAASSASAGAAIVTSGTPIAWGAGTTTDSFPNLGQSIVPAGLSDVIAIDAGSYHSLALKSDGTVVGWGAGLTATGSFPNYGQTAIPAGLSGVIAISAGGSHSLAISQG